MDTSKKPRLVLQHMSKHFDTVKAVEDVSFSVFPGEVRGLIGENGSGKSTLSAMICGSLKPNNGSMELDGQPYHPRSILDARSKGVAILLQERGTIDGMTVAENRSGVPGPGIVAGSLGTHSGEPVKEHVGKAGEEDQFQSVDEAGDHSADPAAQGVAHDARHAAGKEGADDGDQRHAAEEHGGEEHGHDHAQSGKDKAQHQGVGRKPEQRGYVQSGNRIGYQLVGNALEGGYQLAQQHTHALQEDQHAGSKAQGLQQAIDQVVCAAGVRRHSVRTGHDDHQHIEHEHNDGDGHGGVLEELQPLGELHVLGALTVAAHQFAHMGGGYGTQGGQVADGKIVAAGDLADHRLGNGGNQGEHGALEHDADADDGPVAHAGLIETEGHGHRADPHHMSGEENILEGREPGQQHVHQEARPHDDGGGGGDDRHRVLNGAHNDLRAGGKAAELEHLLEQAHKGENLSDQQAGTGGEDQVAQCGLDRPGQHLREFLALGNQAHQGHKGQNNGRGLQQFQEKIQNSHDYTFLSSFHQVIWLAVK